MALAGFGLTSCRRPEAAPGAVHKERRVDHSRQISLLRDGDAAAQRRDSASWSRPSTGVRSKSMAIRCIRRAAGRPTPSLRLRSSIFTIRRARNGSYEDGENEQARRFRNIPRTTFALSFSADHGDRAGVSRRGNAFAHARTIARRAGKRSSHDALVCLRPAPESRRRISPRRCSFGDKSRARFPGSIAPM